MRFVQDVVATWASGECITSYDKVEPWQDITLSVPSASPASNDTVARFGNGTVGGATVPLSSRSFNLRHRRDFCSTIQVVFDDIYEYTHGRVPSPSRRTNVLV